MKEIKQNTIPMTAIMLSGMLECLSTAIFVFLTQFVTVAALTMTNSTYVVELYVCFGGTLYYIATRTLFPETLFDPIATIGMWITSTDPKQNHLFSVYWNVVCQVVGSFVGAVVILVFFGHTYSTIVPRKDVFDQGYSIPNALFMETICTWILYGIMFSKSFKTPIQSVPIYAACRFFAFPISGAVFNSMLVLGISAITGSFPFYTWIYYMAPMMGCLLAVSGIFIKRFFDCNKIEKKEEKKTE